MLLERLKWAFVVRPIRQRRVRGFKASLLTYCSDSCEFGEYSRVYRGCILVDVSLGRFSYMNQGGRSRECAIGAFCSVGQEVRLGGLGLHPRHLSTHPSFFSSAPPPGVSFHIVPGFESYSPVRIGHDVWIGDRAVVLDGVTVGTGAIIAAGAIVTREVKPYEIVAGVPARSIGFRVPESRIPALLSTEWWAWDMARLREVGHLIGSNQVDEFLSICAG
jgi:acetyltransferase-like isoleucine patch superfamily enzyme